MAGITFGKDSHLRLEIEPVSVWSSSPESEGESMEYQFALYCEDKPVFNPEIMRLLTIVKGEEDIYLSDFISKTLTSMSDGMWTMLEPKVLLYMHPLTSMGCCGQSPAQTMFMLEVTFDQNILAGENKVFGNYSNTGFSVRFEATALAWTNFAHKLLEEEEDDFEV
jgi:hypothetical protein